MNNLKKNIEKKGTFLDHDILKVDSFLNHQVDIDLVEEMGECFYDHFKNASITKVVTLESSGIAPAYATARRLHVPMLFIKKSEPSTMQAPFSSTVYSFTKQRSYTICMEQNYLTENDRVLFIDDFLANGEAFKGVEQLIEQSHAKIVGVGICIEKRFQKGHSYICGKGYDLLALASIDHIENNKIIWA